MATILDATKRKKKPENQHDVSPQVRMGLIQAVVPAGQMQGWVPAGLYRAEALRKAA